MARVHSAHVTAASSEARGSIPTPPKQTAGGSVTGESVGWKSVAQGTPCSSQTGLASETMPSEDAAQVACANNCNEPRMTSPMGP
eukprot:CAMPEP_0113713328 /NCGR_PEP_ID=MMETSP0038_2-20120614/31937_1 /TAXON_ID=2898 /ORGANISM="Cryptomonas paramecium" /LENGTH=84 /DNA_ID=CAMNT_0000640055 /DNA_START=217 /DNA_END=472 /DNA_ORIENTATION=- /assembly_acc=CAM_ASM_000170